MKILFYDMKEFEFDYLLDKIPSALEPYFFKNPLNSDVFIDERYQDAEALSFFVGSEVDRETLEKFKNLKYIFLRCTGYSNIDLKYCKDNNIKIYNAANYGSSTVAEYTFALILAMYKKIIPAKNSILDGDINQADLTGYDLASKTIGVIGAGSIGKKVIDIAKGFSMNVLAYDLVNNSESSEKYSYVSLDELLAKSDIISINCPLTEQTRGLIDRTALNKMKQSAIIVNTARGEIINSKDLYLALINNKIQGAALDVVECEEMLCHHWQKCQEHEALKDVCLKKYFFIEKLTHHPNVIITPHNAYNTTEANERILKITLENINSILNNNPSAKNLVLL